MTVDETVSPELTVTARGPIRVPSPAVGTPSKARRPLHIALIGEGAYPFHPGGVSLWCHQLIQGMPEHSFSAVSLTVNGTESSAWTPPGNLSQVVNIPAWGAPASRERDRGRGRAQLEAVLVAAASHGSAEGLPPWSFRSTAG